MVHWSHDAQCVFACVVRWQFTQGGLKAFAACSDYWFMIDPEQEGRYWLRGWSRSSARALEVSVAMEDRTDPLQGPFPRDNTWTREPKTGRLLPSWLL